MIRKVRDGGLQMLDVENHYLALKRAWVPRISMNSHKICAKIGRYYVDKITDITIILKMNFYDLDTTPCLMHIPCIYREMIMAYCRSNGPADIVSRSDLDGNENRLCTTTLWCTSAVHSFKVHLSNNL